MNSSFRVGCSGNGELITADELFEVLILILPEAESIKSAFVKWVSLSEDLKSCIENRIALLTSPNSPLISTSIKDLSLHKGYSMSRVLLRVFHEWNNIQVNLGAPGIQQGFTAALPKALEMDISFMMRCVQEVFEFVICHRDRMKREAGPKAHNNDNNIDGDCGQTKLYKEISAKLKAQAVGAAASGKNQNPSRGRRLFKEHSPSSKVLQETLASSAASASPLRLSHSETQMTMSMDGDHQNPNSKPKPNPDQNSNEAQNPNPNPNLVQCQSYFLDKVDMAHIHQQQMQLQLQLQMERQRIRQQKERDGERERGRRSTARKIRESILFGTGTGTGNGVGKMEKSTGMSSDEDEAPPSRIKSRKNVSVNTSRQSLGQGQSQIQGQGQESCEGSQSSSSAESGSGSGSESESESGSGSGSGSNSPSPSVTSGISIPGPQMSSDDDGFDLMGDAVVGMSMGMGMDIDPDLLKYYAAAGQLNMSDGDYLTTASSDMDHEKEDQSDDEDSQNLTLAQQHFEHMGNKKPPSSA